MHQKCLCDGQRFRIIEMITEATLVTRLRFLHPPPLVESCATHWVALFFGYRSDQIRTIGEAHSAIPKLAGIRLLRRNRRILGPLLLLGTLDVSRH